MNLNKLLVYSNGMEAKRNRNSYFIAYASTFSTLEAMLNKMFIGEPRGNSDRLLDFSTPITGALFFAPTFDMLSSYSAE